MVLRMCGIFLSMRAFSWAETSPCRMECLISVHFQSSLPSHILHLPEGKLQILVNVIGQRLEGRDVEAVDHIFQIALYSHDE